MEKVNSLRAVTVARNDGLTFGQALLLSANKDCCEILIFPCLKWRLILWHLIILAVGEGIVWMYAIWVDDREALLSLKGVNKKHTFFKAFLFKSSVSLRLREILNANRPCAKGCF